MFHSVITFFMVITKPFHTKCCK